MKYMKHPDLEAEKAYKNIFIICSVRGATDEYKQKLDEYTENLEKEGHIVHLPHRDTKQNAQGIDICLQNLGAIQDADEVHIFYTSESQGTHFDMGMAFAIGKDIVIVENVPLTEGKSYQRMLTEWQEHQSQS